MKKVTVGILLITYMNSSDEQPIRWVRLDDFNNLQRFIASGAEQAEEARRIRAEVARLRSGGVSDAQLRAAGVDMALLDQIASTASTWPILSYNIVTELRWRTLRIARTHQLQTSNITAVRLVQRQQVDD